MYLITDHRKIDIMYFPLDQAFAAAAFFIPFPFKMAGDESGTTLGQPHLAKQDLAALVSARSVAFHRAARPPLSVGDAVSEKLAVLRGTSR